ncbi:MAG: uridine kinase [Firmicutes bacterium]|nr:uridine kinase [Candidatus Colivicinus equi]
MKPVLIGIAGGSNSGKTLIARRIYEHFEATHSVVIINEDDYYKDQSFLTYEERCKTNYDHPFAFDQNLLQQQLKDLLAGKEIAKPVYDFTIHNRSQKVEIVEPADVVIFEGLFALENEKLRKLESIKIFVDTDADVRVVRRIKRDLVERGRTLESVMNQYLETVKPMHDEFVEPSKRYADIIIPQGGKNEVALDLLITKISSILGQKML